MRQDKIATDHLIIRPFTEDDLPIIQRILDETFFGLFWVINPRCQRRGYATEAARAMIDYAFNELRLNRIIATTEYENIASQGVMQKVGMTLMRIPLPDPPWLQVMGVLENRQQYVSIRWTGLFEFLGPPEID